jgi:copper chaperone CopZ
VRVSLMSVNGVASVEVSLDKGLATVRLKPGNSVTLKQLQQAITKNGFTMKDSKIVAAGKIIDEGNARKLQVSGSEEILALVPASSASATPDSTQIVVEGTVPEAAKGRVPDAIRYRSLTPEK